MKNVLCFICSFVLCIGCAFATGGSVMDDTGTSDSVEEVEVQEQGSVSNDVVETETETVLSDESTVAVEDDTGTGSDDGSTDLVDETISEPEIIYLEPEYTEDDPLPVTLIEEEEQFANFALADTASIDLTIQDVPPDNPPFYGCCYVTGESSSLGTVTLYFPNTYKQGYFGVDSNGYLVNVSSNSISGYFEDGYNNSVSVTSFSYPRYRTASNYDYSYIELIPMYSNMEIATVFDGQVSVETLLPYVSILMLGVLFVCFMKRW